MLLLSGMQQNVNESVPNQEARYKYSTYKLRILHSQRIVDSKYNLLGCT